VYIRTRVKMTLFLSPYETGEMDRNKRKRGGDQESPQGGTPGEDDPAYVIMHGGCEAGCLGRKGGQAPGGLCRRDEGLSTSQRNTRT